MKTVIRNVTWQQVAVLASCLAAIVLAHSYANSETFTAVVGVSSTIILAVTRRFGDPPPPRKRLAYEDPAVSIYVIAGGKKERKS